MNMYALLSVDGKYRTVQYEPGDEHTLPGAILGTFPTQQKADAAQIEDAGRLSTDSY
jgi:hypothetical protein